MLRPFILAVGLAALLLSSAHAAEEEYVPHRAPTYNHPDGSAPVQNPDKAEKEPEHRHYHDRNHEYVPAPPGQPERPTPYPECKGCERAEGPMCPDCRLHHWSRNCPEGFHGRGCKCTECREERGDRRRQSEREARRRYEDNDLENVFRQPASRNNSYYNNGGGLLGNLFGGNRVQKDTFKQPNRRRGGFF